MGRPKGSKNKHYRINPYRRISAEVIELHMLDKAGNVRAKTLIDAEDFDFAQERVWSLSTPGYAAAKTREGRTKGRKVSLHRVLMGAKRGDEVDHINGNKLDNRKENLRLCTHIENMHNMKIRADNSSGVKGVSLIKHHKRDKPWHSYIEINGKRVSKMFETFDEAVAQRKEWEETLDPAGLSNAQI
jgi:hypothetical protein